MALALTSVSPTTVPCDGGYAVVLTGTFVLGTAYRVTFGIGVTGATGEAEGYSPSGNGSTVYPTSTTSLTVRTPELSAGDVVDVYIEEVVTPATNDTLLAQLAVVDPDIKNLVFQMRRSFSPRYKVGDRNITLAAPVAAPKNLLLYSADYTDPSWTLTDVTGTPAQPDPFGGSEATSFSETAGLSARGLSKSGNGPVLSSGVSYAASVYVKAGVGGVADRNWCYFYLVNGGGAVAFWFNLISGELGSVVVVGLPALATGRAVDGTAFGVTGWHRITGACTAIADGAMSLIIGPATADGDLNTAGSVADALHVAGVQVDQWSVERKYRPTTSSPVT